MLYVPEIHVESGPPVTVRSPYHPDWPQRAKALGGRWDPGSKTWRFDPRDLDRAREALFQVYGWDGTYPVEILDTRLLLDGLPGAKLDRLWMFGRLIAERRERDAPVRLGPRVIVVRGGFPPSGGSRKNPSLAPDPITELEVRDVPTGIVLARWQRWPDNISEVPGSRRTVHGPEQVEQHLATGATDVSLVTGWPKRRIVIQEERS